MLVESLRTIRTIRPAMALLPSAIVEAVFLAEGSIGSAQEVARNLGLRSRFKVARIL